MSYKTVGFTLLEVLVALTLLGLLSAVTAFAVTSLDASAERDLVRDLRATRVQAIESGEPRVWSRDGQYVRFDPDGSTSGGVVVSGGIIVEVDPLTGELRVDE